MPWCFVYMCLRRHVLVISMQKVMSEQSTIFHNREVNYNRLHCYSKVFTAQSHNHVHFKTCLSCGVSLLTRTHTLYKEHYVSLCLSFTVIHTYTYTYLVHNEHTHLPTCTRTHTHTHTRMRARAHISVRLKHPPPWTYCIKIIFAGLTLCIESGQNRRGYVQKLPASC